MRGPVVLVAMPWEEVTYPSIQIGLLRAVLAEAGIAAESRSFHLAAAEHFCLADDRLGVEDYRAVAGWWTIGLGDWIFALPPIGLRDTAGYGRYAARQGLPGELWGRARRMRELVPAFVGRCAEDVLAAGPCVVGFTTSFSQNAAALALAHELKRRAPAVRIVLGGANCDGPMGEALLRAFPWVDAAVSGEAERVLPALVEDLAGGGPVRRLAGVCARDRHGAVVAAAPRTAPVPIDEVPVPDYGEYFDRLRASPLRDAISPHVRVLVEGARGCWWGQKHHCTFCGLNGSSMVFRSKDTARYRDEILELARRHRRLEFDAVDNILDHRYLTTLLPELARARREGNDLTFFYEIKANLRRRHVRALRDAGVLRIQPGIESLSDPVLRLMDKGVDVLQNVRLLKWAAQDGIQVTWNIIYGFPGEPPGEYARMAELVPSLTHLRPPGLVALRLQRFSPYHDDPAGHGLTVLGPATHYGHVFDLPPDALAGIAYEFEHGYADGRDPEAYVAPLRAAVTRWEQTFFAGRNTLRCFRGPGFMRIDDQRPDLPARSYMLGETEARIYAACDAGAGVDTLMERLALRELGLGADELEAFLESLTASRLLLKAGARYLSLAVPAGEGTLAAPLPGTAAVALAGAAS